MENLEIFDNYYFRLNKMLLKNIGLWPYESNKIVIVLWSLIIAISSWPHFAGMVVHIKDVAKLIEHIAIASLIIQLFFKYVTIAIAGKKVKAMYSVIAYNWSIITAEDEKKILLEYSNRGRLLTLGYMGLIGSGAVIFTLVPLVPEILNVINPLPQPRPHISLLNGEFLIEDPNNNFLPIYLWDTASVLLVCIVGHAIDSMYMVSVEHGTALFAIVSIRLKRLQNRKLSNSKDAADSSYEWLVHTIKMHQIVLSFLSDINEAYSLCFYSLIIMNIVGIPVSCVILISHFGDLMNVARWTLVVVCIMGHLFVQFWPGQKFIDHGEKLFKDVYCNDWYDTSIKTKKLLQYFMFRCSEPCLITAGGLVAMNFEMFLVVVKTAASYVTVLSSFR